MEAPSGRPGGPDMAEQGADLRIAPTRQRHHHDRPSKPSVKARKSFGTLEKKYETVRIAPSVAVWGGDVGGRTSAARIETSSAGRRDVSGHECPKGMRNGAIRRNRRNCGLGCMPSGKSWGLPRMSCRLRRNLWTTWRPGHLPCQVATDRKGTVTATSASVRHKFKLVAVGGAVSNTDSRHIEQAWYFCDHTRTNHGGQSVLP